MMKLRLANYERTEAIDLLSGPVRVHSWGWPTKVSSLKQNVRNLPLGSGAGSVGYDSVVETINICSFGCESEIRNAIADLETVLSNAAAYNDDPLVYDSWWLEWLTKGEGGRGTAFSGKRSLILGGTWNPTARSGSWAMLDSGNIIGQLIITRHAFWEDVAVTSDTDALNMSTVGGTHGFTSVPGRVPARIYFTDLASGDGLKTIWMGFRPKYQGLTSFDPVWECESTNIAAPNKGDSSWPYDDAPETLDAVNAGANNGYTAQTTFTDTTMKQRFHITVSTVLDPATPTGVNAKHFMGRYLVLCRCWVNAGSAYIQMRYGYHDSTYMTICDPVVIDNSDPWFREIGTIQIPPSGVWPYHSSTYGSLDKLCQSFTVEIHSQNVDATTLDYDCLVLIPSDYFAKLEDVDTANELTHLMRMPNERLVAVNVDPGLNFAESSASASGQQWYMPIGDSTLVIAAMDATSQDISDTISAYFFTHPRWLSYRDT